MRKMTISTLLCGWFLMTSPGGDERIPLKQWRHSQSFDTALECQDFMARMWEKAEAKYKNQPSETTRRLADQSLFGRCVPSDHIKH